MAEPSYQTVPLEEYSAAFRDIADRIFSLVSEGLETRQTRRDKGSYSIIATSTQETIAKLLIYETERGKPMGNWPLVHSGVYVLVRVSGQAARNIWDDLLPTEMPWHFRRLNPEDTIAVAPNHEERFAYFPVMAGEDIGAIAVLLTACASA